MNLFTPDQARSQADSDPISGLLLRGYTRLPARSLANATTVLRRDPTLARCIGGPLLASQIGHPRQHRLSHSLVSPPPWREPARSVAWCYICGKPLDGAPWPRWFENATLLRLREHIELGHGLILAEGTLRDALAIVAAERPSQTLTLFHASADVNSACVNLREVAP